MERGGVARRAVAAHKRDFAAPDCADASAATGHNRAITLTLPCADADDPLAVSIVAGSPNGALGAVDQGARTVNFAPLPGFSGGTTFTFQAAGGTLATPRTRILTLTVRNVPAGATVDVRCKGAKEGLPVQAQDRQAEARHGRRAQAVQEEADAEAGRADRAARDAAGAYGRYVAHRIRSGKIPKATSRCLPPGSTKPGACPP